MVALCFLLSDLTLFGYILRCSVAGYIVIIVVIVLLSLVLFAWNIFYVSLFSAYLCP